MKLYNLEIVYTLDHRDTKKKIIIKQCSMELCNLVVDCIYYPLDHRDGTKYQK